MRWSSIVACIRPTPSEPRLRQRSSCCAAPSEEPKKEEATTRSSRRRWRVDAHLRCAMGRDDGSLHARLLILAQFSPPTAPTRWAYTLNRNWFDSNAVRRLAD